jgi:enoyl-CoA hydratase/carnithine racemase
MGFAGGRLLTAIEGPIGWLTFNQPERLNAVRLDMWQALPEAVGTLVADPGVRAIVVRGAGDRAFISGADIAEFEQVRHSADANTTFTSAVTAATASLIEAPKPVIAMINGFCVGGGIVISSACDIRICSAGSRFGVPAARLGLAYELDNLARLQSIVGKGVTMEMLATARHFTAEEALQIGYVNRIVPAQHLEASVREMAAMIAQTAPLTFVAAKLASRAATDPQFRIMAQQAIDTCFNSEDFKEGRAAFREKRQPRFTGK